MKNLNGVKSLKIVIQVKFFKRDNKTYQHFIFTNVKDRKYYDDNRFSMYYTMRKRFKELSLENYEFTIEEILDQTDRIIYIFSEDKEQPFKAYYNAIVDFVAPIPSCEYCIYFNNNRCEKMDKEILKIRKNCSLFNQKNNLFST